ncbi:MAG: NAD-dependent epimerase/dehydratase family protein [Chloroflexota bacterium]|nr:NAD-dependent epimerase/dehydratase family protein [Chloroflexota bacterium]
MRILITGGAGFLGSALANTLSQQGHEVLAVDDLSAGDPARLHQQVLFHRGSVLDRPKLWTLLHGVDCVYHLAARVLVAESILYPYNYNKVNVGGTVMLLEAMRDLGIPRLVVASSGAIYGEQPEQPISEDKPPHPDSPYAVSKLAAEHYAQTIGALWGISTTVLRIFNTYGPGQNLPPSHPPVVPRFLQQASGDGSVVIFGDGTQTRDFVYLDDVVTALITAGTTADIGGRTFNIGSGTATSINQLSEIILRITKSRSNIIHNQAGSVGVSRLQADITLAQTWLDYTPQVSLEAGLRQTIRQDKRR